MRITGLALALALVGCDDTAVEDAGPGDAGAAVDAGADAGPPVPFAPDSFCPGSDGCASGDSGELSAGAARVEITPEITPTTDVMTVDVDGDGTFEPSEGDMFDDRDGQPGFQGVWIAGFGNARPASGVHDPLWASTVVLQNGDTTLAIVALDVIGWFKPEMDAIRSLVADLGIDHIAISATHTHQGRDTIGIWGINQSNTGLDPDYNDFVVAQTAQSIRDAHAALERADIQTAAVDLRDVDGGTQRYLGDLRDPIILDPEMRIMRLVRAGTTETIATLVNVGAHAEYMDDENTLLSSDFPHFLREGIEQGVEAPDATMTPGVGGVTVFLESAIGGQIGPNGITVRTWAGEEVVQNDDVYRYAQTVGEQLAYYVLTALGPGGGSTTEMNAALGYRTRTFSVLVENTGFHIAIASELFDREGVDWNPSQPLVVGRNQPSLRGEVTVLDVGGVQMITAPGELDPQLFLGGYDGAYTPPGVPLVDPMNPNPPDLTMAPEGPYLRDLARPDATSVWLLGQTNDYLGYLVPEYNFMLDAAVPYIEEAEGDHYEETNSVGINGWPTIRTEMEQLLMWSPEE